MRTSLYLVRLKIFEWIKLLRRHIYQYRETAELVEISELPYVFHSSLHMQECRKESETYNYKLIQLLNHNKLINGILGDMLDQAWL